jgi:hypothetical protein
MSPQLDFDAAVRAHLRANDEPDLPSVGVDAMLGVILARPQHALRGSHRWWPVSFPSPSAGLRVAFAIGLLLALIVGAGLLVGQQPKPLPPPRSYRGVFTPAGMTVQGRYRHAAVRLADGRVLLVGGDESDASGKSAELFDPATGAFTPAASMAEWRADPTATLLDDGRVLVIGGFGTDVDALQTAELYDPATATWDMAGPLSVPRLGHTATLLPDGRVLVAGGAVPNEEPTRSAELFDPETDSFTPAGEMTVPRNAHTATPLGDGRVLIAGGAVAGDPTFEVTDSAELFDPATGTFTTTGSMVIAAANRSAALLHDGRVLVLDGWRPVPGDAYYLRDAELYDPESGTFARTQSAADDHLGMVGSWAVTLDDGSVLVVGHPAQRFEPASGTFVPAGQMLANRGFTVLTLLDDGRVLVTGGRCTRSTICASAQLFE